MVDARPYRHARTRRNSRPGQASRVFYVIRQTFGWVVVVVMVTLIAILVVVPRILGAEPYTVLTGSMSPSMPPGTIVVVRPVDFDSIRQGDVVTYQIASGQPAVVTHRVVGIDVTDDGVRLRTQGDANNAEDATPVRPEQVRGVVQYWVPLVGYVATAASGADRAIMARIVGGVLVAYAVAMLVSALVRRGRRRRRTEATARGRRAAGVLDSPEKGAPESVFSGEDSSDAHESISVSTEKSPANT